MALLDDLRSNPRLKVRCPSCDGTFALRRAQLFDAKQPLPRFASDYLNEQHQVVSDDLTDLKLRRKAARERPARAAEAVRIGKVVEKIAPSLPGFPLEARDCRALFEPIDYVAFKGLSNQGIVDCVVFVDVKSGSAVLQPGQRKIKQAIESGRVSLETV